MNKIYSFFHISISIKFSIKIIIKIMCFFIRKRYVYNVTECALFLLLFSPSDAYVCMDHYLPTHPHPLMQPSIWLILLYPIILCINTHAHALLYRTKKQSVWMAIKTFNKSPDWGLIQEPKTILLTMVPSFGFIYWHDV